jgi:hypothetical protein
MSPDPVSGLASPPDPALQSHDLANSVSSPGTGPGIQWTGCTRLAIAAPDPVPGILVTRITLPPSIRTNPGAVPVLSPAGVRQDRATAAAKGTKATKATRATAEVVAAAAAAAVAVGEAEGAPAPASEASIRVSTGRGSNLALPVTKTSIPDSSCV